MTENLKVVFFGTPDFAMPVLKALIENGYNVSHFRSKNLKDDVVFEEFKNLKPNLCVVAAYGKIIPKHYLEVPKYGFINIHPSLLPKYRGPSPIQTAILNDDPAPILSSDRHSEGGRDWYGADTETGVTIMLMDEQVDHGPILAQKPYCLLPTTYYPQAEKELAELGAKLLVETLPKHIDREIKPAEQDHSQATFTKMFSRNDGRINWNEPAEKIYNRVRALNPEPGTWTLLRSSGVSFVEQSKVLNISEAEFKYLEVRPPKSKEVEPPGLVRKINGDIAVATGKCYLILKQIQLEGGKKMDAKSFINGHPDFLNSQLE